MSSRRMLSFSEAKNAILQAIPTMWAETVDLREAHKRILAEDIIADVDLPAFDNSSMDGYAIRALDTADARDDHRVRLEIVGEVRAGGAFGSSLNPGATMQIMTGAPIPEGADAVVEQELVEAYDGFVEIRFPVAGGRNVRRKGEEIGKGEIVLGKGTRLTAACLGVLASLGAIRVKVHARPSVGILTTGNEVVDVHEPLSAGKIRNSNAYTLRALVSECGCEPVDLGRAGDDRSELQSKISEGLRCDVLVTSGGVSVGKHDLVLQTLTDLGVDIRFWKVNIRPGMPTAFGLCRKASFCIVPVFALPGNPVSTMVTFLEFVRPALRRISVGIEDREPLRLVARLEHDFPKMDTKRHFARGIVRNDRGGLFVRTTGSQSSGILSSLVAANCLIVIPEERRDLKAGEEVEVELL